MDIIKGLKRSFSIGNIMWIFVLGFDFAFIRVIIIDYTKPIVSLPHAILGYIILTILIVLIHIGAQKMKKFKYFIRDIKPSQDFNLSL